MDPGFIQTQLQKANELLDNGKPGDALRCLEQVNGHVFDEDDKIEFASLRAWALAQLDRGQQALDELQPVMEEFPDSPRLHATHGVVLSSIERLEDACEALEKAVSIDNTDGIALANLGFVYEKLEEFERAIETYDQALENGADMNWVLQRKASAQREMEDFAAARTTLKRYLSIVPDDDFEWISLAIVLSELGEFDESFDCYRRAESLNSSSASLRFNWGLTAERAGNIDLARNQLELLCQIDAESTQASILRAFILEHEGKLQPAFAAYTEALDRAAALDRDELLYAFARAMDFCAEHDLRKEAESLIKRAYRSDACSVEVCEAYREMTGRHADNAYWFGMLVQLERPPHSNGNGNQAPVTRLLRGFQVIGTDRDDAAGIVTEFLRTMGEKSVHISEFTDEELVEDDYRGIYEVEAEETIADVDGPG